MSSDNTTVIDSCKFGDYYQDYKNSLLYLCLNGRSRTHFYESVDLNGIFCRDVCTSAGLTCKKEVITR